METASSLAEGITKMDSEQYDVVITDLKFEGHGGEETISWLADNQGKLPPIIVLTGDDDIFIRRRCMMFGANDFWTKTDAQERPDLFFKSVYNRYLANYPDKNVVQEPPKYGPQRKI